VFCNGDYICESLGFVKLVYDSSVFEASDWLTGEPSVDRKEGLWRRGKQTRDAPRIRTGIAT
jgi:hypothetical protein